MFIPLVLKINHVSCIILYITKKVYNLYLNSIFRFFKIINILKNSVLQMKKQWPEELVNFLVEIGVLKQLKIYISNYLCIIFVFNVT